MYWYFFCIFQLMILTLTRKSDHCPDQTEPGRTVLVWISQSESRTRWHWPIRGQCQGHLSVWVTVMGLIEPFNQSKGWTVTRILRLSTRSDSVWPGLRDTNSLSLFLANSFKLAGGGGTQHQERLRDKQKRKYKCIAYLELVPVFTFVCYFGCNTKMQNLKSSVILENNQYSKITSRFSTEMENILETSQLNKWHKVS